jgi:hypothetical protein
MKKYLLVSVLLFTFCFLPALTFAVDVGGTNPSGTGVSVTLENPITASSLQSLLYSILSIIVQIAIPVLVVMVIYTGFLFVSAKGNPQKLTAARGALTGVLIGALIILGAYAIAQAIQDTVNKLDPSHPVTFISSKIIV